MKKTHTDKPKKTCVFFSDDTVYLTGAYRTE